MLRALLLLCILASVAAFAPVRNIARQGKVAAPKMKASIFEKAMADFEKDYPQAYARGWGPTPLAERWNGRHAMFGWVALVATAYAKGHGLFPDGDVMLSTKDWGTLAYIYGGGITNERAIIIVGHLHCLFVSVCAAVAPLSSQQKLYYQPGDEKEEPAGVIIKPKPGLTADNELFHGRFAMLGLVALVGISTIYQIPILDVINAGVGGAYGTAPLMGTAGAALATKVATIAAPPAAKVAAAAGAAAADAAAAAPK